MPARLHTWAWLPAVIVLVGAAAWGVEEGVSLEDGHSFVADRTLSPDGRLGVTVPVLQFSEQIKDPKNRLVEVKTGRVIAELKPRWEAWNRMNHGGYAAWWSQDGTLLRWDVGGKWCTTSLVIVKLKKDAVVWQKEVVTDCHQAILQRLRAKAPEAYAREKEYNKGNGAAFPEGFTVDVATEGDDSIPKLPLKLHVDLTSDPKLGHRGMVDAWLDAVLDENGKLSFGEFKLERRPGLKNAWAG